MADTTEDQSKEVSYLDMSDEELLAVDPSTVNAVVEPATTDPVETVSNDEGAADGEETDGNEEANEGQAATETQSEGLLDGQEGNANASAADQDAGKPESNPDPKAAEDTAKAAETPEVVDYESAYKKLTAPFKANGRDITVKNVDDAIALMQMGANYNKKMAALKPNLKLMKMLENNGLLNEERIGFLIDLEKKNPEAISKLVKDSGLDPLDLDPGKASDYKPKPYTVDDREMELDAVLDEIQGTPTYNQTLQIVSNTWDGPSKQIIANQPQLLKLINTHVQSGVYDLISKEVESERVFGRLNGLSDIEAYRQVGDSIQARGGFNHLAPSQGQQTPNKPVIVQPKPKTVDDSKLREKKRAASPSKPAVAPGIKADYNPLALSDDAFSKLVNDKYL